MGPIDPEKPADAFQELSRWGVPAWATAIRKCIDQSTSDPISRYAQIATVDSLGKPHLRTLVMRGCLGELSKDHTVDHPMDFWMATDHRSSKIQELALEPQVEIGWYFPGPREQFRLSGTISILTKTQCPIRSKAWQSLSTQAKVGFYWPNPLEIRDPTNEKAFQVHHGVIHAFNPPDSFSVLVMHVARVDHLILQGDPQNRYIYHSKPDQGWVETQVNP